MFAINYGSNNRELFILNFLSEQPSASVILASAHLEQTIKRAILKLSVSPTAKLRTRLEEIYTFNERNNGKDYKSIWKEEISSQFRNSSLGTIIGNLHNIKGSNGAYSIRSKVVHGSGTVSKKDAEFAVKEFIKSATKIREFVESQGEDLDSRLKTRRKVRSM